MQMKRLRTLAMAGAAVFWAGANGHARVFLNQEQALRIAFPPPAVVERKALFLDEPTAHRVEQLAQAKLEDRHVPYYVGRSSSGVDGYAFFSTHIVKTMPETVMIVITPQKNVKFVEVLAFNEPEDYLPPRRWLGLFRGRPLDDKLRVKRGLRNVTGATLTTYALTDAVRRALAIAEIALPPEKTETP
jgi:hypothetical protein